MYRTLGNFEFSTLFCPISLKYRFKSFTFFYDLLVVISICCPVKICCLISILRYALKYNSATSICFYNFSVECTNLLFLLHL